MESSYRIECVSSTATRTDLKVGFAREANNATLVSDAKTQLDLLGLKGGALVTIDGPCSLPVAYAIAHAVCHKFGAVSVWDPKLGKFVVAISHRPDLAIGTLME